MRVSSVAADHLRSLDGVVLDLGRGVTAVVGPNGAGKTNLVEAAYFALTARSFRTSDRRDLIPFGSDYARVRATVVGGDGVPHEFMSSLSREHGSRYTMDGSAVERAEAVVHRPLVTVFSPDRLELVKGPPAVRRTHLDTWIAARWPNRAAARLAFGRALAQRNALLSRIRSGASGRSQLATWTRRVAITGAELTLCRKQAMEELREPYEEACAALGLTGENSLRYRPAAPPDVDAIESGLDERTDMDLRQGRTSWGPHHDEVRLEHDGRQLRRFGSQGQQRIGLLALLFAERTALLRSGSNLPLMLLDDVMSELDGERREFLVDSLGKGGQCVLTAAERSLVPPESGIDLVVMDALTGRERRPGNGPDA